MTSRSIGQLKTWSRPLHTEILDHNIDYAYDYSIIDEGLIPDDVVILFNGISSEIIRIMKKRTIKNPDNMPGPYIYIHPNVKIHRKNVRRET